MFVQKIIIILGTAIVLIESIFCCATHVRANQELIQNGGFELNYTGWSSGRWWLVDGVSGEGVIAIYQARGAVSKDSAKTNLAHPASFYLFEELTPSWEHDLGFITGHSSGYYETRQVFSGVQTVSIRFSGSTDTGGGTVALFSSGNNLYDFGLYSSFDTSEGGPYAVKYSTEEFWLAPNYEPSMTDGVLTIVRDVVARVYRGYRNGVIDTPELQFENIPQDTIFRFGYNVYPSLELQAIAIFQNILSAEQVAAITRAMNGLGLIFSESETVYTGSGSIKFEADVEDSRLVQSFYCETSGLHEFSVFAYTDGSVVTEEVVELYISDEGVDTNYTSVGGGWYKLSGMVMLNSGSYEIGVTVKGGQTVYLDDFSLKMADSEDISLDPLDSSEEPSSDEEVTYTESCRDEPAGNRAARIYGAIVDDSATGVTLYFTEASMPVTKYVLKYGTTDGKELYGVPDMGVNERNQMSYVVNGLSRGKEYFFQIRSDNGCQTGPFSNLISVGALGDDTREEQVNNAKQFMAIEENLGQAEPSLSRIKYLRIKINDEAGKPVNGAMVVLFSEPKVVYTNEDGIAEFRDVETGNHRLVITYNDQEIERYLQLNNEGQVEIDESSGGGVEVEIVIRDKNNPINAIFSEAIDRRKILFVSLLAGLLVIFLKRRL